MQEALFANAEDYDSFNHFFTRQLKTDARPIAEDTRAIISPVDGCVAQMGEAHQQQLLQAKNFYFTLESLLGGDKESAAAFADGSFATLYLAPRDYHRVHMPLNGTLDKTIYVPGDLFSVNRITSEHIPNLYSRNERLITLYNTEIGRVAVILVGAMIVGNIQTSWSATPARHKDLHITHMSPPLELAKAAEIGYFHLGSTVILLFEKNRLTWTPSLASGSSLKMGQVIGQIK